MEDLLNYTNLRYSTDKKTGYSRKIQGKKFKYFNQKGNLITEKKEIERINKLAIPPAYKNVWICPYKNGHLQATGYDSKGRKQYRYHPLWITTSQKDKFMHLLDFAYSLPKIRKTVKKDLSLKGMDRKKVLAALIWLLENTLIRIGNEEYKKDNNSYGLTTLKNKHVNFLGTDKIVFQFKGKSGIYHKVNLRNKKVTSIIRRCKELPGQDLFEYIDDDGKIQSISSYDVNEYLRSITGKNITAKDFRTWGGTVLSALAFDKIGAASDEKISKKNVVETVKQVAKSLRNKPNTCRKYYIHPSIIEYYTQGLVLSNIKKFIKTKPRNIEGLDECENKLVAILQNQKRAYK